jgi:hypothetical protein
VVGVGVVVAVRQGLPSTPQVTPPQGPAIPFGVVRAGEPVEMDSCDAFIDPARAAPASGTRFNEDEPVSLSLSTTTEGGKDAVYTVVIIGPDGETFEDQLAIPGGSAAPFMVETDSVPGWKGHAGPFAWGIGRGVEPGGDSPAFCQGSTFHSFLIEGRPEAKVLGQPAPTATPSATPTADGLVLPLPPITAIAPTPTHTPGPDAAGPSIKSVSDSPDPIQVTQPKGCTPTTPPCRPPSAIRRVSPLRMSCSSTPPSASCR